MTRFGYALSSEEHAPADLVRDAALAEEAGFDFALISDHFHPWIDAQGHAPFVWSVLGAIARETSTLEVGTGVTCPMIRIHPAIIVEHIKESYQERGVSTDEAKERAARTVNKAKGKSKKKKTS